MGDCLFPDHAGKQETGGTLESMIDHTLTCSTLHSPSSFSSTTQPVEKGIFYKGEGGREKIYRQGIGVGSDLPSLLNKLTREGEVFRMSNRSVHICIIFRTSYIEN